MDVIGLLLKAMGQVWLTLQHNWPFLLASIVLAAAMKLYIRTDAIAGFLRRYQNGGVVVATAAAVGTPLCSCGTTAIVLGMMAGTAAGVPWAPIIAFMVSSPLTSPEELLYSAGLFGWPFAVAFFVASIVLGLAGGLLGGVFDARGWLRNQARLAPAEPACGCSGAGEAPRNAAPVVRTPAAGSCGCTSNAEPVLPPAIAAAAPGESCGCSGSRQATAPAPVLVAAGPMIPLVPAACCAAASTAVSPLGFGSYPAGQVRRVAASPAAAARPRFQWQPFAREVFDTGRRLLVLFLAFATVGYLINDLIPSSWITSLFGSGHAYSVPLAATLGLPFYINTEASLPLVRGMLASGMSAGAALAFLITGAGTSIGAVAGALTIARWRVIALVIGTLWVGAILCGFAYDALLAAGML